MYDAPRAMDSAFIWAKGVERSGSRGFLPVQVSRKSRHFCIRTKANRGASEHTDCQQQRTSSDAEARLSWAGIARTYRAETSTVAVLINALAFDGGLILDACITPVLDLLAEIFFVVRPWLGQVVEGVDTQELVVLVAAPCLVAPLAGALQRRRPLPELIWLLVRQRIQPADVPVRENGEYCSAFAAHMWGDM